MKPRRFYDYAYDLIKSQKLPYITKASFDNLYKYDRTNHKEIFKIFDHVDHQYGSGVHSDVVTCEGLSILLKEQIKKELSVIRRLRSKTTSNKIQYADLIKVPGTENYRQVFHYEVKLSPEDRRRIRIARKRVANCRVTGRLKPDLRSDAPVYMLHSKIKLWNFHMLFKSELLSRIKELQKKSIQKRGLLERIFKAPDI